MNRGYKSSAHFAVIARCAKVIGAARWFVVLALMLSISMVTEASENEDWAGCIGHINGVIDSECEFEFDASLFLKGSTCEDFGLYTLEVKLPSGKILSGSSIILDESVLGETIKVNILPNPGCNFEGCWGTLSLEDKLAPLFPEVCSRELPCREYRCTDWNPETQELNFGHGINFPDFVKEEVYSAECSDIELFQYTAIYKSAINCLNSDTVIYYFTAKDVFGNASSHSYYFVLDKIILGDITFPGNYKGDCVDNILPEKTGSPLIDGKAVPILKAPATTGICNIAISYADKTIPTCKDGCENSRKIIREWSILDWCSQVFDIRDQLIELSDTLPPIIEDIEVPKSVPTDPWTCSVKYYELPIPDIDDNCTTGKINYHVFGPEGVVITTLASGHYAAWEMHIGKNEFIYVAEDCCGNISLPYSIIVKVLDELKPNAIAKEFSVISLVPEDPNNFAETAIAKLFAKSLDNDSWDACGVTEYYVRRADGDPNDCDKKDFFPYDWEDYFETLDSAIIYSYDEVECRTLQDLNMMNLISEREQEGGIGQSICNQFGIIPYNGDAWGNYVSFCCEDSYTNVNNEDVDGDGQKNEHQVELIVFDEAGNWNITWGWVKVEDPTPPEFVYIKPINLFCHDTYNFVDGEREIQKLSSSVENVRAEIGCNDTIRFSNIEGPYFMKGGSISSNPDPSIGEDPHPSLFGDQIEFLYENNFRWQAFNRTCGYGYGWMRYTAKNIKGTFAIGYQLIRVAYKDDFSCASVYWPENDHIVTDCENIPPEEDLLWDSGPCELIGWTFSSDTFFFETNSCRKIINEYTVINWCVNDWYKDQDGPTTSQFLDLWVQSDISTNGVTGYCNRNKDHNDDYIDEEYNTNPAIDGVYTFQQVIKIVDTIPPILANSEDWYFPILTTECETEINISNSAFDPSDCTPVSYNWELFLDYDHDGNFDETYRRHAMDVFFTLPNPLSGPMDSISARWKVWDGCGNTDIADFKIYTIDKKPPTPYCIDISSALMVDPDGEGPRLAVVELWAADFDKASTDNCYGNNLFFTFDNIPFVVEYQEYEHYYSKSGLLFVYKGDKILDSNGNTISPTSTFLRDIVNLYNDGLPYEGERVYKWLPPGFGPNESNKYTAGTVFNSAYTDGLAVKDNEIIMTVWDGKFNSDYCLVTLTLRCQTCTDGEVAIIAGTISTETSIMVEDVTVELAGLSNPDYKRNVTTINGGYAFGNTPMYEGYDLVALRDGDDIRGVNTLDLLLIQRHILGLTTFMTPYKIIAADANNDRSVSGTDIIILRKLVLGYYDELPQNTSWKFIDASQLLSLEEVLIDYREVINIPSLESNRMSENYIAVKIGDVNDDVFNARGENQIKTRNNESLRIIFRDQYIKAGESVSVSFSGNFTQELNGIQLELQLDGLSFSGIGTNNYGLTSENFGDLGESLRFSCHSVEGLKVVGNLFELTFKAKNNGNLRDMISLSNNGISNEVYYNNGTEIGTIELGLEGKITQNKLFQNDPNPFNEVTIIGFELEKTGSASFTIHDVTGKTIKIIQGKFEKGYNKIQLNKNEIPVRGVLYYTLNCDEFTGTKKMILIE
jgi:hypothetical protein